MVLSIKVTEVKNKVKYVNVLQRTAKTASTGQIWVIITEIYMQYLLLDNFTYIMVFNHNHHSRLVLLASSSWVG